MASYGELKNLLEKYLPLGIAKGGELLLPLDISLHFLDDLRQLRITVMGADGWYYLSDKDRRPVQDISIDYYVGDDTLFQKDAVETSIQKTREFVLGLNVDKTPLVSFTLDIPNDWVFFRDLS